jgi:hypothetical protein
MLQVSFTRLGVGGSWEQLFHIIYRGLLYRPLNLGWALPADKRGLTLLSLRWNQHQLPMAANRCTRHRGGAEGFVDASKLGPDTGQRNEGSGVSRAEAAASPRDPQLTLRPEARECGGSRGSRPRSSPLLTAWVFFGIILLSSCNVMWFVLH